MAPISVTLARLDPPAAVVALVGEHDAYSSQRLENELAVLLEEGRRIVVDLRDTTFVDSTTLAVLLGARHCAAESSLGFALLLPEREYTQVNRIRPHRAGVGVRDLRQARRRAGSGARRSRQRSACKSRLAFAVRFDP